MSRMQEYDEGAKRIEMSRMKKGESDRRKKAKVPALPGSISATCQKIQRLNDEEEEGRRSLKRLVTRQSGRPTECESSVRGSGSPVT